METEKKWQRNGLTTHKHDHILTNRRRQIQLRRRLHIFHQSTTFSFSESQTIREREDLEVVAFL